MNFWQSKKTDIYVQLYDEMTTSLKTNDELIFLKQHFDKKQQLIEFGCGTGRTLIPLLKDGYKITGLDFSMGMIKILHQKMKTNGLKTTILNKDLTNFKTNTKFDGGILSQRTLNFITSPPEQRKALANISKVLKKSSYLIINLMPARPDDFANIQKTPKKTESFINTKTGNKITFFESWIPHPMEQTWSYVNEFHEGKNISGTKIKMRIIFEQEAKYLLELCGFETIGVYGNWKRTKFNAKAKDMIIIAKKR